MELTYLTTNTGIDSDELVDLDDAALEQPEPEERLFGPFNYTKDVVDEIVEMTSVIPLFDKFSPAELRVIVPHMQILRMVEGQCLFSEGEESDYMCFIVSGRVDVFKHSQGGKLVVVSRLSRGRSIGEMAMIDTYARSATAIARSATTMLMIKREHFDHILDEHPKAGIAFLRALTSVVCLHLRRTSNQYADVCETAGEAMEFSGLKDIVMTADRTNGTEGRL